LSRVACSEVYLKGQAEDRCQRLRLATAVCANSAHAESLINSFLFKRRLLKTNRAIGMALLQAKREGAKEPLTGSSPVRRLPEAREWAIIGVEVRKLLF